MAPFTAPGRWDPAGTDVIDVTVLGDLPLVVFGSPSDQRRWTML
jgi:hypothetical protein